MQTTAAWAEGLARTLLADTLPRRWATSRASPPRPAPSSRPSAQTPNCSRPPRGCTTSATSELAATGLHAYGARYLRDLQHADPMLCRLVAHHS